MGGKETGGVTGARAILENYGAIGSAQIEAGTFKRPDHLLAGWIAQQGRFQASGIAPAFGPDHRGIGPAIGGKKNHFHRLQALAVLNDDTVTLEDLNGTAAAAGNRVTFDPRGQNRQAGDTDTGALKRVFKDRLGGQFSGSISETLAEVVRPQWVTSRRHPAGLREVWTLPAPNCT
ncbi:MAG: hypothetical protein WAS26_03020 [Paracoccaceae bacterium]